MKIVVVIGEDSSVFLYNCFFYSSWIVVVADESLQEKIVSHEGKRNKLILHRMRSEIWRGKHEVRQEKLQARIKRFGTDSRIFQSTELRTQRGLQNENLESK